MSLPRYPDYKNAGADFGGVIPSNWTVKPLKHCLTLITGRAEEKTNSVGLENIEGWTARYLPSESEFEGAGIAFRQGDILFGKLRPYLAKVYQAEFSGEAVGDFHVIRPTANFVGRYGLYQILQDSFISRVDGATHGAKMPRVGWEYMGNMSFAAPSLSEQSQIARFLDHETAKIDVLIREQERLIALLQEKRQAVISHAVTKGLDPNVPMKDSGVEWLGEVPEHWRVGALKRALEVVADVDHYMPSSVPEGVPYVMTGDLQSLASEIEFDSCKQVAREDFLRLTRKVRASKGDVIMARYATIGTVSYVDIDAEFVVSYSCVTIRSQAEMATGRYLFFYFQSDAFIQGMSNMINANTQGNVGIGDLKEVQIALPDIHEQEAIVDELEVELTYLDGLVDEVKSSVGLMKERRSALISAAVTGKIDVREWQPPADDSAFDEEIRQAGMEVAV